MRVPHWIVVKARAAAFAVLERTATSAQDVPARQTADPGGESVTGNPDSALERWKALVAVAAPSLLHGDDGESIRRTEADAPSPRYARSTAGTFEQSDDGHARQRPSPASTPAATLGPTRDVIGSTPVAPPWSPHRVVRHLTPVDDVASVRHLRADLDASVPTPRPPGFSGASEPLAASSWNPERPSAAELATLETPAITALFTALQRWGRRRRRHRIRDAIAPRRSRSRPTRAPSSTTDAAFTSDPPAARGGTDRPTDRQSMSHRHGDDRGGNRPTEADRRRPPGAPPPAPDRQISQSPRLRVATTPPAAPIRHPYRGDAADCTATSVPVWPALPPSPLDRDGVVPNRLPSAVESASPCPETFGARWSAEQEAH